jgi:hypothetical protein
VSTKNELKKAKQSRLASALRENLIKRKMRAKTTMSQVRIEKNDGKAAVIETNGVKSRT